MKTAIILGGGPAGCQCALWLTQLGYPTLIVEESDHLGGLQAMSPYTNNWLVGIMHQTGKALAHHMEEHIRHMDIPVLFQSSITSLTLQPNGLTVTIKKNPMETKYLVIATGVKSRHSELVASNHVLVGPGQNVFNYDFKSKRVAILGGGDNAAENYAFIKSKQPKLCHIYARTIRARKNLWKDVDLNDVYSFPEKINQDALTMTHQETIRHYDVFVVMYGWEANFPQGLIHLEQQLLDERGFIMTDETCQTPIPRIYAIGEVANRMHPCVATALADGVVAAKAIQATMEKSH